MKMRRDSSSLGRAVQVKIDRPKGSHHPQHGFLYPVNYGYVPGTLAPDGDELDAYVLGVEVPLEHFEGVCVGVIHRLDDVEDKLVVTPAAARLSAEEILHAVDFQERYFESMLTLFFPYERLTWPEAADLARDTPLVLPLGGGYPLERLAEALGYPARVGLLPAIPYGWRGSGLEVPEAVLGAVVHNLVGSLREDGFTRAYALLPAGCGVDVGEYGLYLKTDQKPARPLPEDAQRGKVILIPFGHTEQHGYHLPLDVDTRLIEAVAGRTAEAVPELAACLPVVPYGVSTHRSSFAGTLNCGGRAFEDFCMAAADVLNARGFETLYFLSGHGGSCSYLVNAVKAVGERHPNGFAATAWLYLSGPQGIAELERHRQSKPGGMGHACELETSLYLHLNPADVHMERAVDEVNFIETESYRMDWVEGGALIANPPWEDDTATGAYGAGSLGTPEKGRLWLEAAAAEKVQHVCEILEQQRRRTEKRRRKT